MIPISLTENTKVSRFYDTKEAIKYSNHPIVTEVTEITRLAKEKMYHGIWSEQEYLEFSKCICTLYLYDVHHIYPVIHKMLESSWEVTCQELDMIKSRDFFDETIIYKNKIHLLVQFFKQVEANFNRAINFEYIGLQRGNLLTLEQKIMMYETILDNLSEHNSNANKIRKKIYQWIEYYFENTFVEKELLQLIEPMIHENRGVIVKQMERAQLEKARRNSYYNSKIADNIIKIKQRTAGYHIIYRG